MTKFKVKLGAETTSTRVYVIMLVPWFWICREIYFGFKGPLGEEPFTQRLMSVKSGSDIPVKLQPLLIPLEIM